MALIVKKQVMARLDPAGFAGRSLRAGLIATAMRHDLKSGAASDRSLRNIEDSERNAADLLGL